MRSYPLCLGQTVGALRVRAEIIFTAFGTGVGQRYGATAPAHSPVTTRPAAAVIVPPSAQKPLRQFWRIQVAQAPDWHYIIGRSNPTGEKIREALKLRLEERLRLGSF